MKVQNDIANVQGRSLAFSSDVGAAYAQTGGGADFDVLTKELDFRIEYYHEK